MALTLEGQRKKKKQYNITHHINKSNGNVRGYVFRNPPRPIQQQRQHQKRQANTQTSEGPSTRSKRSRISSEQYDHSGTPVNDNIYHDFDDHPGSYSSANPIDTLPLSHNSPNLPDAVLINDNEEIQNETQPSLPPAIINAVVAATSVDPSRQFATTTVSQSETSLPLSVQATPPASNNVLGNSTIFPPIKYWRPYEKTVYEYCEKLGIQFNRDDYDEFIRKIKITPIRPNSEPINFYTPIDQSGFGCFSMFLTGNEDGAKAIKDKVDRKFIDALYPLDSEKIIKVVNSTITIPEHFETIAAWLKCRIIIYSYGKWEQYGDFESDDDNTPLFVLAKNSIKGNTVFYIVLSLKHDDQ